MFCIDFLKVNFGHSIQRRVAVVKPTVNKSLRKRMGRIWSEVRVSTSFETRSPAVAERSRDAFRFVW